MPKSMFKPYGPGELKALRTLRLTCDAETGRTEPFVWTKPGNAPRLTFKTREARQQAMKVLKIKVGECWQRPLA